MNVQSYLDNNNKKLTKDVQEVSFKNETVSNQFQKQEEELNTLRKEKKELKKALSTYELLLKLPKVSKSNGEVYVNCHFLIL